MSLITAKGKLGAQHKIKRANNVAGSRCSRRYIHRQVTISIVVSIACRFSNRPCLSWNFVKPLRRDSQVCGQHSTFLPFRRNRVFPRASDVRLRDTIIAYRFVRISQSPLINNPLRYFLMRFYSISFYFDLCFFPLFFFNHWFLMFHLSKKCISTSAIRLDWEMN